MSIQTKGKSKTKENLAPEPFRVRRVSLTSFVPKPAPFGEESPRTLPLCNQLKRGGGGGGGGGQCD